MVAKLFMIAGASIVITWVTAITVPAVQFGADYEAYRAAGQDLQTVGDPYATTLLRHEESQYRYPPLLALTMPLIGSALGWYAVLTGCLVGVVRLAWRDQGWRGLMLPTVVAGPLAHNFLVGNAQIVVVGLLMAVPRYQRAGPVALAAATSIKLWPALGVVWFIGRRDWRGCIWYMGALALLIAIQAPWLDDWIRYWQAPEAAFTVGGISLRVMLGIEAWIGGAAVTLAAAFLAADSKAGWPLAVWLMLIALPRAFLPSLAILATASSPRRDLE